MDKFGDWPALRLDFDVSPTATCESETDENATDDQVRRHSIPGTCHSPLETLDRNSGVGDFKEPERQEDRQRNSD